MMCAALLLAAEWQSSFNVNRANLGVEGSNPYFPLTPGLKTHYSDGKTTIVRSVLAETKTVDGIETRVVEDRESKSGQLVEVARDYYAIDRTTGDVYYFGEDVDMYSGGKIKSHEGAWLSGVKGARFGLMMPGTLKTGQRFMQENAPGVAMDRAEVAAMGATVTTPAGTFRDCVEMKESSAIEGGSESKWYAPGAGMVKEGKLLLVRIEKP